jgi:hypothetical protein
MPKLALGLSRALHPTLWPININYQNVTFNSPIPRHDDFFLPFSVVVISSLLRVHCLVDVFALVPYPVEAAANSPHVYLMICCPSNLIDSKKFENEFPSASL